MSELDDYTPSSETMLLEAALQDAARDARHRAFVPSYDLIEGVARGRRAARWAATGVFGVVLCVVIGVAAAAGVGRVTHHPQPAATRKAVALDPSLRKYLTTIPILTWSPDDGFSADEVSGQDAFRTAVFSPLKGDHDYSQWTDLRKTFPAAPVGGNAVVLDQSFTRAQLDKSAANVRKVHGVKDARVVEVRGLWFTVTASVPATGGAAPSPIDLHEIQIVGGEATGAGGGVKYARATYVGPPITRATFDLMRRRAAEAVQGDVSNVVVKAESAT